jgi:hypothetical protein
MSAREAMLKAHESASLDKWPSTKELDAHASQEESFDSPAWEDCFEFALPSEGDFVDPDDEYPEIPLRRDDFHEVAQSYRLSEQEFLNTADEYPGIFDRHDFVD